jgi:glycolate oxidase iron-sulfur subunit
MTARPTPNPGPPLPAARRDADPTDAATASGAWAGLDACVHCGFCLPACPTYEVTSDEADSPRGRIVLMRALAGGEMAADDASAAYHLDRCLGCRACEGVCPSGVIYGPALERARSLIAGVRGQPAALAAGLWTLARPERQRLLWLLARAARATRLPEWLVAGAGTTSAAPVLALAMLAATRPRRAAANRADGRPPAPVTETVALLRGCVMDGLFGHVHGATVRALAMNGVAVREVPGQVCCGALAAHAGDDERARAAARANVRAFDAAAPGLVVVTDSAGCGAMLKAYGEALADDPLADRARAFAARVKDVSEVLAERGPRRAGPLPIRVAYDAPCHLLHAQKVADAPLALLRAIPELELVPLEGSDRCCGSAGVYSLLHPDLSLEVLGAKLSAIAAAAPDVVATGNPGCLMHIGAGVLLAGLDVELRHPIELLDLAYGR